MPRSADFDTTYRRLHPKRGERSNPSYAASISNNRFTARR